MSILSQDASSPRLVGRDLQRIPQDALYFLHLYQENAAKQAKGELAAAERVAAHTIPPPPPRQPATARKVSDKSAGKARLPKPAAHNAAHTQILQGLVNGPKEALFEYVRKQERERVKRQNADALEEALEESSDEYSEESSGVRVPFTHVGITSQTCWCNSKKWLGSHEDGSKVSWCRKKH